jgi:hypothetical protein
MTTETLLAEVIELLPGFGVAHAVTSSGLLLGLNRQTPGIEFDALRVGDQLICEVEQPFSTVRRAAALPP